jgi:hypothetical protein
LAALRYLVARLDAHRLVKRAKDETPPEAVAKPLRPGLDEDDERWWMPLN